MGFGLGFEESALIPSMCFSILRGFNKTPTSSFVARMAYNWKYGKQPFIIILFTFVLLIT